MAILSVLGLRVAAWLLSGWMDRSLRIGIIAAVVAAAGLGGWLIWHRHIEAVRREAVSGITHRIGVETAAARARALRERDRIAEEVERTAVADEAELKRQAETAKGVRDAIRDAGGVVVFRSDDEWLRAKRGGGEARR